MTSAAKTPKDKTYAPAPRLLPRPTAASAARAARNATNRNLSLQPSQRQSPIRASASPSACKLGKSPAQRTSQRSESKTELKDIPASEIELPTLENAQEPQNVDGFLIENPSTVNVDDNSEDNAVFNAESTEEPNETDTFDEIPTSRPVTPAMSSRPQTPSVQLSRPQTPLARSRPSTPANPPHHSTPASRPNTPQYRTPTRPTTPSSIPTTVCNRVMTPTSPLDTKQRPAIKEGGDVKSDYISKQRIFHNMKKELDLKQQALLEVFDCLKNMREHMMREGAMPGNCGDEFLQQELVVFNVADWSSEEVAQLCRDAIESATTEGALQVINTTIPIDECTLTELDEKLNNVPACFANLCLQAFTARQEIIDWVKELVERSEINDSNLLEQIAQYNTQGLNLCETLRELKTRADEAVESITQISKRACQERGALLAVSESLVREIERLRRDIDAQSGIINELRALRAECDLARALDDTKRELEEEKAARAAARDKLATTESQLRQTRGRIAKMDRQLREAEASIASLTGTVKILEDQSRQRETQLEARARKLKENLKTGEVTSSHLAQQRDALQNEVTDLKEQIEKMTAEHKSTIQSLNGQLKELKNAFDDKCKLYDKETELKKDAEISLAESQVMIEELKAKITELENSKPNPELPTEREMDLWAELQATKDTLRITEEEVNTCKREKVRFLEGLTKIAESDNKVGMQQKLAAELLSKEEIVAKMQMQIRELTKNIKHNEQKVIQYEQYVRDLQAHNRAVANCQEAPNGISYQDLQQEDMPQSPPCLLCPSTCTMEDLMEASDSAIDVIMNLRMGLLEAVHRNEELSEVLVQKEQQLEQQDKTSRAQARVIKVREELINMLKNKETEQSRELATLQRDLEHRMKIVEEVNKQIASKAEEIQELFTTLENKQQQIHRLEKIVLALEEQQRRAQAQRTRHEEKIAALEHELAAGGQRRERKFLFF